MRRNAGAHGDQDIDVLRAFRDVRRIALAGLRLATGPAASVTMEAGILDRAADLEYHLVQAWNPLHRELRPAELEHAQRSLAQLARAIATLADKPEVEREPLREMKALLEAVDRVVRELANEAANAPSA
jgi:hypothetical protein